METPYLLLNCEILERNLERMQKAADGKKVLLRPHLKTAKSADVAKLAKDKGAQGIAVSTLKEAEYFAEHGFLDIIYAVGMTPDKLERALALVERGVDLKIMTDNRIIAEAIIRFAGEKGRTLKTLIELDCGDHRAGITIEDPNFLQLAQDLDRAGCFAGVLTHAGHSYGRNTVEGIADIAAQEAACAVSAAEILRSNGIVAEIISIGSTPTALADVDLGRITEIRAGVYVFFDVDQYSRGVCRLDEIALCVVSTVIGHNRVAGKILIDAGGLALSKDLSADRFMPKAGFGLVCDFETGAQVGDLSVSAVSQEHGHIQVSDVTDYEALPIGAKVRVLPIHACMTAAAYEGYHLCNGGISGTDASWWPRVNGW